MNLINQYCLIIARHRNDYNFDIYYNQNSNITQLQILRLTKHCQYSRYRNLISQNKTLPINLRTGVLFHLMVSSIWLSIIPRQFEGQSRSGSALYCYRKCEKGIAQVFQDFKCVNTSEYQLSQVERLASPAAKSIAVILPIRSVVYL
jgi:hypothetical protein